MKRKPDYLIVALILYLIMQVCFVAYLINASNVEAVQPIQEPKTLHKAASIKLNDLMDTKHWAHTNSNGCDLACRMSGLPYTDANENLYHGKCDLQNAIVAWQKSPAHQKVLNIEFDELVLIAKVDANGQCYIVYNSVNY